MNTPTQITHVDEITRSISFNIAKQHLDLQYETEIKKKVNTASVKGFRAGKAPRELVEKLYGESVKADVRDREIRNHFMLAMKQIEENVVGSPEITELEEKDGINLKANVYIMPTPEITQYTSFNVEAPDLEVTEELLENQINKFKKMFATREPLKFRVKGQVGDVAELSYLLKGEKKATSIELTDDSSKAHPFTPHVMQMEIGESKTVMIPTGEGDKQEEYTITLDGLAELVLPEINDEFVEKYKIAKTVLDFRMQMKDALSKRLEEHQKRFIDAANARKLVENHDFKIPQVMIDSEVQHMVAEIFNSRSGDKEPIEPDKINVEPFREHFAAPATERVKVAIIIDRIIENEAVDATMDECVNLYASYVGGGATSDSNEINPMYLKQLTEDKALFANVQNEVKRAKVLDLLRTRTTVTTRPLTAEELDKI